MRRSAFSGYVAPNFLWQVFMPASCYYGSCEEKMFVVFVVVAAAIMFCGIQSL
jgi:hypothetical protein